MAKEYFLKIDKIPGDSTRLDKYMELESFSWGARQKTSHEGDAGVTANGVDMDHFTFTTKVSTASPKLMQACASGDHVGKAVLIARRPAKGKQEEYLNWTMENVIVSSFRHNSAGDEGTLPSDTFTLAFDKITLGYKPQAGKDSSHGAAVTAGYDLRTMKSV